MQVRGVAVGFAVGVLVSGAVAAAWASIPDVSGVIHGCYNPSKGYKLRVLDTAQTPNCPAGWTALDWNKRGPKGASGTTIVARPRATGLPIQIPLTDANNQPVWAPVTITPSSWPQAADEVQQSWIQITVTMPSTCHDINGQSTDQLVHLRYSLDGGPVSTRDVGAGLGVQSARTEDLTFRFEPGTAVTHSIQQVAIAGTCHNPGENPTLDGIAIDVAGMQ